MNRHLNIASLAVLFVALTPFAALAQETPKTGLVMASPGSVALTWQMSETVAIRPEVAFSTSTAKSTQSTGETSQRSLTPGFSVLFYTAKWDSLRIYVAPRYTYQRAHGESTSSFGGSESTATAHNFSGSFGAEYSLHRRFAAFGEVGIAYSHGESPTSTVNSWNQRAAAGAIFYF